MTQFMASKILFQRVELVLMNANPICTFYYHFGTARPHMPLQLFSIETNYPITIHGCWEPSDTRCQSSCCHGADLVFPKYPGSATKMFEIQTLLIFHLIPGTAWLTICTLLPVSSTVWDFNVTSIWIRVTTYDSGWLRSRTRCLRWSWRQYFQG